MKLKWRILCCVLSVVLLCGLFVGCMPGMVPSIDEDFRYNPQEVDYNMEGTVKIWWSIEPKMMDPLNRAIEKFNKIFPKIKINVEAKMRADYFDDLNLSFTSENVPDVVRLDHVYIQSLGESKRLVNLELMTDGAVSEMEESKFIDMTWDAMSIGNNLYGLPLESNTTLFMYNERICKEVFGADYAPPTTYEELKEQSLAVKAYKDADGNNPYLGFIMPINANNSKHDIYVANGFLARFGASILNEDRTECLLDSPEAIEAFTLLQTMMDSGVVDYVGYAPYLENQFIYEGTVAFLELGSWIYNDIINMDMDNDGSSDIKVAKIPVYKEGIPGYATLGSSGMAITSACKNENKPAAYEFIKFLSTDYETHLDFAKEMKVFPSLNEGLDDPYYTEGDQEWVDFWSIFKEQLMISVPRPGTMYFPSVETLIKKLERQLSTGLNSPAKICGEIKKEMDEILKGEN